MKKLITLMAIAAAVLSGCTNNEKWIEESIQNDEETIVDQFTVSANDYTAADDLTRSAISKDPDNSNVLRFTWLKGDAIGVFPETGMQMKFPIIEGENSKTASFDGNGWSLKSGMKYAAYYPYNKLSIENEVSGEEIPVVYAGQKQLFNGSIYHLSKYDFMVSKSKTPNRDNINFDFEHLGCILSFDLQIPDEMTFSKLTLMASKAVLTNSGNLNVFTGELIPTVPSNNTSIDLNDITVPAGGTLKVYMMIAAADLSGQTLKLILEESNGNEHIIEGITGRNLQREKAYSFTTGSSQFTEVKIGKLISGINFNSIIKKVANTSSYNFSYDDLNIRTIKFVCNSTATSSTLVSEENSDYPIYANFDPTDGIMTISTAADRIALSSGNLMFSLLTNLSQIENLSCLYTSNVTDLSEMFKDDKSIIDLDLSGLDTKNVELLKGMFKGCISLSKLNLSNFNTNKVKNMIDLFNGCNSLTSLDLSYFDTSKVQYMNNMFTDCYNLTSLDLSNFDTRSLYEMSSMFKNCKKITNLDLSNFDTPKLAYMNEVFYGCESLELLDISSFNTSNVVSMNSLFADCLNLTNLDLNNFDTKLVANMSAMFLLCKKISYLDLRCFDTQNVTDMGSMFRGCESLEILDISSFNTSKVIYMGSMFSKCSNLTSLDLTTFDTGNVTTMNGMFEECSKITSLNLNNFNTSKVTLMGSMFNGCSNLTSLKIRSFNTRNVTYMYRMFGSCKSLSSLDLRNFETSNVTMMGDMFEKCTSLKDVNLSSFNTSNVTDMINMFSFCESLNYLRISSNFKIGESTNTGNMMRGVGVNTPCIIKITGNALIAQDIYYTLTDQTKTNAGDYFNLVTE